MISPETSKEILNEAKALTSEVYKDIAKPALQEVGSVAGRTVKALLFPIRGMLWGWEQIEIIVEEGVKKKFEKIPEERRKSPEPEIAVPLLQALTYTAQNETLREMYINLLANSMDKDKEKVVHPSFVEIIKQMNTLDAKVFEKISQSFHYQRIINPSIAIKNTNKFIGSAVPDWYIGWTIEGYNEFDVSASLVRISKFGLIELMLDRTAEKEGYDELKNTQYLIEKLNVFTIANQNMELEIKGTDSIVYVNEYGKQFKSACQ
ncbi:DUF4393 domain-containing protein [Flavobacterium muglaense]|uniref:DUF4393 domain-containing protein n=1 Tax=Flavobacterium muglaense TaxID=2764716 RepID=A0A923SGV6_9FLAO|nr:DUF4393 domain-containing protein [Flavobacterium muglaense]MBC5839631.1 DUF4393 domain-containing protein [Flavobacterium muglaense]MBC5846147.1 DUF4393 domain-containing protein [Flavobacterium muglaense]